MIIGEVCFSSVHTRSKKSPSGKVNSSVDNDSETFFLNKVGKSVCICLFLHHQEGLN